MNLTHVSSSTSNLPHDSQPTTPLENQLQIWHRTLCISLLKQMLARRKTSKWHPDPRPLELIVWVLTSFLMAVIKPLVFHHWGSLALPEILLLNFRYNLNALYQVIDAY